MSNHTWVLRPSQRASWATTFATIFLQSPHHSISFASRSFNNSCLEAFLVMTSESISMQELEKIPSASQSREADLTVQRARQYDYLPRKR
ncbi:hypothetical protein BDV33DRAFT_185661 [Aspergillus novoparasiticus]|uniref:Uncharacterized protein n=1 Tax=Aspergillus novoparasiticus TaxID=986946 RepID=A0A5N6E6W4_9EURO|nr:hypothetical protein BDV33DRAFT_185661 [Aspergillus novoparasiticus]